MATAVIAAIAALGSGIAAIGAPIVKDVALRKAGKAAAELLIFAIRLIPCGSRNLGYVPKHVVIIR